MTPRESLQRHDRPAAELHRPLQQHRGRRAGAEACAIAGSAGVRARDRPQRRRLRRLRRRHRHRSVAHEEHRGESESADCSRGSRIDLGRSQRCAPASRSRLPPVASYRSQAYRASRSAAASGWLVRKHGLALDNLLSAQVVLADGRVVTANASENEDLFWAIRGGGGNFGVVTSFEFRVHPAGTVLAGVVVHPADDAGDVLRRWRDFEKTSPNELTQERCCFASPTIRPLRHNCRVRPSLESEVCTLVPSRTAKKLSAPLRGYGHPAADTFAPMPYNQAQRMADFLWPPVCMAIGNRATCGAQRRCHRCRHRLLRARPLAAYGDRSRTLRRWRHEPRAGAGDRLRAPQLACYLSGDIGLV